MDALEAIMTGVVEGHAETFHEHELVAYSLGFTTILCDK